MFNNLHNDLSFLSERMKIEKVEKLAAKLHAKKEYFIHIINLDQAFNHEKNIEKSASMSLNSINKLGENHILI